MDNDKRTTREGWYNRHLTALPNKECVINIIHKDIDGEHEHLCEWKPFNKSEYTSANMPGEGYLGTATVIKPPFEGIGFHAWEQNNSQFIYYKIIEHPTTETETKKEPNPIQLREYQIEVFNDSTVIWDGDRKVITLPYDSTQALDKAINNDND